MFREITLRLTISALLFSSMTVKPADMVLKLGSQAKFIQVTPAYSNAVVATLLPYYSDFAKKLDLPISLPIKAEDIARCAILPDMGKDEDLSGASITLKNGFEFYFGAGHVFGFSRGNTYYGLQDPDEIPRFYGQIQMTTNEAVKLARETIKKIGIPLEDVFADREPEITLPSHADTTNVVPRYELEWPDPCGDYIKMEINAETKQVEFLYMLSRNLKQPSPKIDVSPSKGHGMFDYLLPPPPNPEYARKLIPIALKAIDEYAQKLSLPIPRKLTTNEVAIVQLSNNGGWPHCEITLTNGWRFIYRHTMINGYYSPDNFFDMDYHPFHLKDFEGKWNLNTNQAIELVKKALAKLNYPTNNIHMDFAPEILYAARDFRKIVPRYFFEWYYDNATHDDLQSKVEAEVNADNGKLESLYYDDKAYWNSRPPIDVPISTEK
jgi:nitrogen fixation protein